MELDLSIAIGTVGVDILNFYHLRDVSDNVYDPIQGIALNYIGKFATH